MSNIVLCILLYPVFCQLFASRQDNNHCCRVSGNAILSTLTQKFLHFPPHPPKRKSLGRETCDIMNIYMCMKLSKMWTFFTELPMFCAQLHNLHNFSATNNNSFKDKKLIINGLTVGYWIKINQICAQLLHNFCTTCTTFCPSGCAGCACTTVLDNPQLKEYQLVTKVFAQVVHLDPKINL